VWELGRGPTTHHERPVCYEYFHRASGLAGFCEDGNKPSGSIKDEFLDWCSDC